eukprot:g14295.t1
MTGFRGQKFDFTGEDGKWYCLISDWPSMHVNMRVTTPVPSLPEITYITGISVVTTDSEGFEHSIVIELTTPHSLESTCPTGVSPCLADSALSVFVDGTEELLQPGTVPVAPGVIVSAVNLPGACRSFGFEKYWERKKLEYAQVAAGRMLIAQQQQSMYDWILDHKDVSREATGILGATVVPTLDDSGEPCQRKSLWPNSSAKLLWPVGCVAYLGDLVAGPLGFQFVQANSDEMLSQHQCSSGGPTSPRGPEGFNPDGN